jgi:hypothetical protein
MVRPFTSVADGGEQRRPATDALLNVGTVTIGARSGEGVGGVEG